MRGFKKFFNRQPQSLNDQYRGIPDDSFDQELKNKIHQLEHYAEEVGKSLQNKYAEDFQRKTGKILRVWIQRDIDGDLNAGLSAENAFEKEYRSLIAIDWETSEMDEELEGIDIPLWYYFGGYRQGTGTIYNLSQEKLELEIVNAIEELLKQLE
ncbi:hypothetical protein SAMN04487975_11285 [Planococcus glaciei]|uniref:hypothetical protein n=1 Tax=Planococcus glaciei TaxID=459472 RepID=UPI00087FEFF7|nr:hypothetical protein [Planococcus glaciei]SDI14895.1 hypothetical protein SAMN04487975_11285 [Planococcus glaciei]